MESVKASHVKKPKKKQMKEELDRIKQAEKKRRRLEKALATSAAIRSELEKKKLKKKEEQQRLDEEGAAIAEAVALHVLLEEDSDDGPGIILKNDQGYNNWHHAQNLGFLMDGSTLSHRNIKSCSFESIGCFPNAYEPGNEWRNEYEESNKSFSSWPLETNSSFQYLGDGAWKSSDISAGLIAAQVVASLQIGEDAQVDPVFFNRY